MAFDTTSWGPESSAKISLPKIIDSLNALKDGRIAEAKQHQHDASEIVNEPSEGLDATSVQGAVNALSAKIIEQQEQLDTIGVPATDDHDGLLTAEDKTKIDELVYATQAETLAGVAVNKIVNPNTLARALSYSHIQPTPAKVWTIVHNLNRHAAVTVVDSAGSEVEGEISHPDLNTIVVTFAGGFSGKAHVS